MCVCVYQFIAKFNGSILVASLFARATTTEDTNPLELWHPYLSVCLHLFFWCNKFSNNSTTTLPSLYIFTHCVVSAYVLQAMLSQIEVLFSICYLPLCWRKILIIHPWSMIHHPSSMCHHQHSILSTTHSLVLLHSCSNSWMGFCIYRENREEHHTTPHHTIGGSHVSGALVARADYCCCCAVPTYLRALCSVSVLPNQHCHKHSSNNKQHYL